MKRHYILPCFALVMMGGAIACDDDDDDGPTVPAAEVFTATLNGANERPTPRTTPATGTATFSFRRDTLSWTINLSNITNVTASHIHIGDANTAGGILLNLVTTPSNTLITGLVTRSTYTLPSAPNQGITFDALLDLMRNGGSYVNVHTSDGAAPIDTGPGDFPGGEIRGQIVKTP
jgi:hypothetical protein